MGIETVQTFADGRIFTGQQALELGVVDHLGSEEDARRRAAELAGLDPDKTKCVPIEDKKPPLSRLLSGGEQQRTGLGAAVNWVEFELATNGQPLWLYRP